MNTATKIFVSLHVLAAAAITAALELSGGAAEPNYGALTVLTTTNFVGVAFKPIPCPHPGCAEGHHSFTATEKYMIVRDTWAEVVNEAWKQVANENYRISSDTNDWGSLSHPIAHPAVYFMHTQPGWAVRPGTRWPLDMPPLPPWEAYEARRRNVTVIPPDPKTIQAQLQIDAEMERKLKQRFGAPTSTNSEPNYYFGLDDSSTGFYKNSSNVLSFSYKGKHVFSSTNLEAIGWLMLPHLPKHGTNTNLPDAPRFLSVPATNELRNSRRFKP